MDGTPVFDIKPYLPYVDSHPDAEGGFTDQTREYGLRVDIPECLMGYVPEEKDVYKRQIILMHTKRNWGY